MYSDEDDKRTKTKKKIKVFSLGYFSQLMNKKIYSDDFDMSGDKIRQRKRKNYAGSLVEFRGIGPRDSASAPKARIE